MEPKVTPANAVLIILNILVMAFASFGGTGAEDILYYFGVLDWQAVLYEGEYFRLLTAMFLHFGLDHFFQNMVFLFLIGCYLETALGSVRYFIFYLLSGIGAGLVSVFYHAYLGYSVVSVGASGAVFGIIGGLFHVVLRNKGQYEGIGTRGLLFMIAGALYYGFASKGVDNAAHLGGFLCGFVLCFLFYGRRRISEIQN